MAQGISDANYKAVYNSLRQQGYSHADAVREATGILAWGAAPEDPVFGTPESRVDGAPSEPLVMDAVVGQQDLGMPYPPMSYGQYRTARQRAERGLGPMPQDAFETDADIRARYDGKYGHGSYDADAPGRKWRSGIEPGPADAEGYGGFAAAMAEAETGMTRAQRIALAEEKAREWDRKKAEYDQATGLPPAGGSGLPGQDGSGRDWSNWKPGMPLPAEAPDGSVLADNARRAREVERKARDSQKRNEAIGEKYGKDAQAIAEAGDARGVTDYDATRTKAEQDRIDYRREQEMLARQGNDAARANLREQDATGAAKRKEFRDKLAANSSGNIPSEKERWAQWRAQSMLAGGQPTGGARGTKAQVGALMMLPESDRAQVIKDRMMPRGQGREDGDFNNKLALLRADMEARAAEGRAARESEATERDKDRELRREERASADAAAERRWQEERAQRDAEFKDRERKYEQDRLLASQRHDATMAGQTAQTEALRQQGVRAETELQLLRSKQEQDAALRDEARQTAARAKAEQDAAAIAGPGGIDIVRGNYNTPDAQAAFKKIAADSDQTWNGFFTEDAERMDAVLVRLGITDPERRRAIVQEYGINSDFPGYHGRGSVLSSWRVAHPAYAPVSPPQQ
jgi:hypothetical protein